ncbi:hypothetical protein [Brevibacillus laterosporus]|uniref:Uncharacterized protein n=1 Tax=Brevibacillus laterosporus LMG 15441 TaxID=1042163 RepID=A0A075R2N5_BRELA|nr:hypothetical protein [Brevibacillus laterosporus]AIG26792.1 hypothetical protein BRLA_c024720 [Brevibacillus laterosporus LMG 15441]RJL13988.1 hypothetical protein DM460_04020 [Brevibacillus laterosporus]
MYIKACKKDGTTVHGGRTPLKIGEEVDFEDGNGYLVKDFPSLICGHPGFDNPYNLCFFEVEPRSEIESNFSGGTLQCRKLFIKRVIQLDELKELGDRLFNERCNFFEPSKYGRTTNKAINRFVRFIKNLFNVK